MAFTQRQQTTYVIDIRICQNHIADWAIPQGVSRMQKSSKANLFADIRRTIQETPTLAICRNSNTRLSSAFYAKIAGPSETTNSATTIPLWGTAARRAAKHNNFHT